MKILIICVMLLFSLVACDTEDASDYKEKLISFSSELKEYNLKAEMTVVKEEGNVSFDIVVDYLEPNYYKVRIQNKSNNNIQVIVKNNDGVYVLTPELNKQFKFNSDWPLNSSHAYLFQSIVKDITNDKDCKIETDDTNYIITSNVNNKTNAKQKTQKTTFNKKTNNPVSNTIYDAQENPIVKVNIKSFNTSPGLKSKDFNVESINNTIRLELSDGATNGVLLECVPTFLPEGYQLEGSLIEEKFTVFTYINEQNIYTISCFVTEESKALTSSREFDDILLLNSTIGFISENSLSFFQDNLFVSIYNKDFNLEEAVMIANSFK
jgi:outer membrane lipoprotein-sorting protein